MVKRDLAHVGEIFSQLGRIENYINGCVFYREFFTKNLRS